ncbi:LysR family transcriptional regulator [Roseateles amylovorans]|uniref:LysR family transcriptional regulator n=2 Tax=Roseateles amylovorans TaxID=2978473 RepID=A0ABY6B981_9BURK|nr:LysR family transcriptional regulator [Roseateles amylovorans]UXH81032.1 LysR family transcriptional regulator [Roseateles amylovorans]
MIRLADLELLVRIADLGNLTQAAKSLDWSPAAASAALKRLEADLGFAVFVRSTRSLRLSGEGQRYLPHARQALQALSDGQSQALASRERLSGELHLAVPSDLGRHVLLPWLEQFQERHPDLSLRLQIGDSLTDLKRRPVDAAVRYGLPPSSSLVALPLLPDCRRILVAAPHYLALRGMPATPADMRDHEALRYVLADEVPDSWQMEIDGVAATLPLSGRRVADDGEVVKRWAIAGLGVAYKSWPDVAGELASGQLVHVNPHWRGALSPLNLVVPGRHQLSPAMRALRDELSRRLDAFALAMPR